jgi:hypothetical protein
VWIGNWAGIPQTCYSTFPTSIYHAKNAKETAENAMFKPEFFASFFALQQVRICNPFEQINTVPHQPFFFACFARHYFFAFCFVSFFALFA